jgi:hypothetical protein
LLVVQSRSYFQYHDEFAESWRSLVRPDERERERESHSQSLMHFHKVVKHVSRVKQVTAQLTSVALSPDCSSGTSPRVETRTVASLYPSSFAWSGSAITKSFASLEKQKKSFGCM